jgi:hypothetical protein
LKRGGSRRTQPKNRVEMVIDTRHRVASIARMIQRTTTWNRCLNPILALAITHVASAAVFLDELDDTDNLSSSVNLAISSDSGSAVFEPSATLLDSASVTWSNGGNHFPIGSGQILSFFFSSYSGGTASSFTQLTFTAVYNDLFNTEIELGSDQLLQYVANGDTGNYAIPLVAGATEWALRMDFDIQTDGASGTLSNVRLDYLQLVPEPSSLALLGLGLPFFLRRRR